MFGTVTVAAVTPIPSSPSVLGVPALGGLASPGLAGTAGIQPQLNVDELLEWAHTVSGADQAGALAGAG
ncbi:hypothetical protein A5678_15800 [Mycobacterium sp. E2733]|nr:hypothetical protein A5678_15800 [Mycobacterium sp. E2733]